MLTTAKQHDMLLLTKEQHLKVQKNIKVNLVWFNVNGVFIGPYAYPEQVLGIL